MITAMNAFPSVLEALRRSRKVLEECREDTIGTPTEKFFADEVSACDEAIAKAEGR